MYIVMSSSQTKLSALTFLVLSNFYAFVTAEFFCGSSGNYTRNSTYEANLNTLFSSLSSNIYDYGFYNASAGQNPDRVTIIALCRGDTQPDACRNCFQEATVEIVRSCPNQREAIFYTRFPGPAPTCMLRYSNESIIGILATDPVLSNHSAENAISPVEFTADLTSLLDELRGRASSGGSLIKVAAGNRNGSQTIYGLVQCTPDLTRADCDSCLVRGAERLSGCCYDSVAVRLLVPSCRIHYDIRPFYNETRLHQLIPTPPELRGNNGNSTTRTIVIVVVSVVVCVVVLALFVGFLLRKKIKWKPKEDHDDDEISVVESLQYDFGKIRASTDDFSEANKLGQGGFGSVYKGKLQNGPEIAVKRLSKDSGQGDLEFKNEVMLLARLQHRNLVRLLGFSLEGNEKLLVYEFVQNASLDNFLFDETKRPFLDWVRRYKIIRGIARGILYLHEDSRLRIIHRDIKASNVLLDGDMNPKIADFGMARLFVPEVTQGSTSRIVGTYGYMAPEYAMHGQFSVKSDVFSFGVLVLEIVSGQKNNCFRNGENVEDLLSNAWDNWSKGTAANLIDPMLIRGSSGIPRDILRCIHSGLLCVQENVADRPTMASVVLMLNSFSISLPIPSEPSSFMPSGYDSEALILLQESNSKQGNPYKSKKNETANSGLSSTNEASITDLYPR